MSLQKYLGVTLFTLIAVSSALATGAGKSNVACQGTIISATDDLVSIINGGKAGQTFCIEGEHRITSTIDVKTGQSLIGTTNDSRISGAVVIGPWQATSTQGVYYYEGSYAHTAPHRQMTFSAGFPVCYWVTTYLDDIFFRTGANNDQRIMRVLSLNEVDPTQPVTTQGQAVTGGEAGRFFFDYTNHRIYVSLPNNQDPNAATVDLALSFGDPQGDSLIFGPGAENVTLQNLFIEKGMDYGIQAGNGWTMKDVTVRFFHNIGAYRFNGTPAQPATIDDTLLTNNGRMGLNSAWSTTDLMISNSEMSWNNIANFRQSKNTVGSGQCLGYNDAGAFHIYADIGTPTQPSVTIDHLWSHNNVGDGLWSDGGTQYIQITNSVLSGNERNGYFHEISCQIQFTNNTVYDNGYPLKNNDQGGGGVELSDSNYANISSNLIYGNDAPGRGFGVLLTMQQDHPHMLSNACLGAKTDYDTTNAVKYNSVANNTVYSCADGRLIGKVWGVGGSLNSRGNQYLQNAYYLRSNTATPFSDGNSSNQDVKLDWSEWQQSNHDANGSLAVGCTYGVSGDENVIYPFGGNGGPSHPDAGLVADKSGNLYGTTRQGGAYNRGTVFEVSPGSSGWTQSVLYSFTGNHDGAQPSSTLVFDARGHLYGTTSAGGGGSCTGGCGTVFELAPSGSGWTESVLYAFDGGGDGQQPASGVVLGASGVLYGTTLYGGMTDENCPSGCGTVYAVTPGMSGWSQSVLYAFAGGSDGSSPYAGLTIDAGGTLYGTTMSGGSSNNGTIFMVGSSGGHWIESVLYAFDGKHGSLPYGGLVRDAGRNLYGTTYQGGSQNYGVVFELSPVKGGGWNQRVLHEFYDEAAGNPAAGLVFDSAGSLYGTAMQGGNSTSCSGGCGAVFKLAPTTGKWEYSILHIFGSGDDGFHPTAPLLMTGSGNLFGTTQSGGTGGDGTVFEIVK
ncbi:MAG TPA: choice-of-anchor tandem repeat GloVer-containing protein [Terriglobales bacterium]